MADSAQAAPTSALQNLQDHVIQRVRVLYGSGGKYNDVQAMMATFNGAQAAFDYAFALVAGAPNDHQQLATLVADAITEDYTAGTLGGKAYQRLGELTSVPAALRPEGTDSLILNSAYQLQRAVEADLYRVSTRGPDWIDVAQRATKVVGFLVPFIHTNAPHTSHPQLPRTQGTNARAARMGHLLFLHTCWRSYPDDWAPAFCRALYAECTTADTRNDDPFSRDRKTLRTLRQEANADAPYYLADEMLNCHVLFPQERRLVLLTQTVSNVAPLLKACTFEDKSKLGIKVDALVQPYRETVRQSAPQHYRGPLRGLMRVAGDINRHLMREHAIKRGETVQPDFDLKAAQVTVDAEPVDTRFGPRVAPQSAPLSPLQQDALRVKAERHRADLRNRHGLRRAMARFNAFAIN